MAWTWEPDTFAAHWFDEGNDRMPTPLRYRSRFATIDEFEAHRAAVRAVGDIDEQERIRLLVQTLAQCDMRIEILFGSVKHRGGDGRTRKDLRVVGARTYAHAVVLSQTAIRGEDSDIRAQLLRADQLPAALAAAVPPCEPGRDKPATFDLADVKPAEDSRYAADLTSARRRFEQLARRSADGGGHAILRLGNFHAAHNRHRALQWCDITGDGRYVEQRNRTHLELRPASTKGFGAVFAAWIEQAERTLRENADDAYF
ncbi:ESX secretion-associated protein EspG [Nocardia sienata]|uniref:ESX secretion-associated protein EspG n=1 Tax=Nocardia sienata TaxID=248552 RepID=UPI0007A451C4|nr:ESX secretion-associated protein EspG [Nocardia sienata]